MCVCVCALCTVYALKAPQGVLDKSLRRNAYENVPGSGEVGKRVWIGCVPLSVIMGKSSPPSAAAHNQI